MPVMSNKGNGNTKDQCMVVISNKRNYDTIAVYVSDVKQRELYYPAICGSGVEQRELQHYGAMYGCDIEGKKSQH